MVGGFGVLRGAGLLIRSRNKSIQRDSAKLGSLKLYAFSKRVKCMSIRNALSSKSFEYASQF